MLGPTSSIANYMNIFGVQSGGQPMGQLAQTLTAIKQGTPADAVTFSPSATMLQQFLNSDMQGDTSADSDELDMLGLAQLKQKGEMLASMLQAKMKGFESNLMSNLRGAGLPPQDMNIKNGDNGLLLMGDMPNKDAIQNMLGGLQGDFMDIARLAEMMNMLQQLGPDNVIGELSGLAGLSSAAQYAQQSLPDRSSVKRPATDFVMHVMQSGTSFSFE